MLDERILEPGDILLYSRTGIFSRLIRIKTWSAISHCEMYLGGGLTLASRDGKGVKTYELETDGLARVLRPTKELDMNEVVKFHNSCVGQGYDWWGLLRFFTIGAGSKAKQFCSEYLTRLLRAGGVEPFTPGYDADLVSPGMFEASGALSAVWSS